MILIHCDTEQLHLELQGHSNLAPRGEDLVCCAVSTLTVTLARNLKRLEQEGKGQCRIRMTPGKAELVCKPKDRFRKEATLIYQTVATGLQWLSHSFPENVTVIFI